MLWQNRDPLVRASAIQLLAGLMNIVHTMSQLLNAIVMAPSDLCHTLLQYITNKEECCLVKEEACIAFSNMLKNCNIMTFHCVSMKKISIHQYKIREVKYIQKDNFFE
jgi:sensor c-di-GMP phosphodiesterase-like protein